jgi:bis(5'-nucleosyl)-tetraphosphatase (symmetrical)
VQTVFVGDVQGCAEELDELLARAGNTFGNDGFELWLVGDLVNRGPASLRVLERVRARVEAGRARVVLGNHEIALIAAGLGLRVPGRAETAREVLQSAESADWIDWLRRRPLVESGRVGARRFAMVHAAVAPGWTLAELIGRARRIEARLGAPDRQAARALLAAPPTDPDRDALALLTRCRSVDARGRWSAAEPKRPEDAWHRRWAAAAPDYAIVYGHWAMQGLHVAPGLRGLDTGCVHHGRGRDGHLTAWLPDAGARDPFAVPDGGELWSVPARRAHYLELRASLGLADPA